MSAVTLRRASVQLAIDPRDATIGITRQEAQGWVSDRAPGLVIHKYAGFWQLTHAATGRRVGRIRQTRAAAVTDAIRLAGLTDWTPPNPQVPARCQTCDGYGWNRSGDCADCHGLGVVATVTATIGGAAG